MLRTLIMARSSLHGWVQQTAVKVIFKQESDSQSRGHCPQLPHVEKRVHFALLHLPAGVTPSAYIQAFVDT